MPSVVQDWPSPEAPAYLVATDPPSFTLFATPQFNTERKGVEPWFAREMANLFDAFSAAQEPLGAEFANVLYANISSLYES